MHAEPLGAADRSLLDRSGTHSVPLGAPGGWGLVAWEQTLGDVLTALLRVGRANPSVVMTRLYLADVALRAKQPDEAATLAQQALDEAQALPGGIRYSNRTGLSYLSLAEARRAAGKTDEARQALTSALEHLQETLGPDHPATRRAVALDGRMTVQSIAKQ